jgi:hypothetical protein
MHLLYAVAFSAETEDGLGYALYARDVISSLEKTIEDARSKLRGQTKRTRGSNFISSGRMSRKNAEEMSAAVSGAVRGSVICPVCSRLVGLDRRNVATLLEMLGDDPDFARVFAGSKGVCTPHFAFAMEMLPGIKVRTEQTAQLLVDIELKSLKAIGRLLDERMRKYRWDFRAEKITQEEVHSQEEAMNAIAGVEGLHCKTRKTSQYWELDAP